MGAGRRLGIRRAELEEGNDGVVTRETSPRANNQRVPDRMDGLKGLETGMPAKGCARI